MAWAIVDENGFIKAWSETVFESPDEVVEFNNYENLKEVVPAELCNYYIKDGKCFPTTEYKIASLKSQLTATDYISAKLNDSLIAASGLNDILKVLSEFKSRYSTVIEQRKQWRKEINELEALQ